MKSSNRRAGNECISFPIDDRRDLAFQIDWHALTSRIDNHCITFSQSFSVKCDHEMSLCIEFHFGHVWTASLVSVCDVAIGFVSQSLNLMLWSASCYAAPLSHGLAETFKIHWIFPLSAWSPSFHEESLSQSHFRLCFQTGDLLDMPMKRFNGNTSIWQKQLMPRCWSFRLSLCCSSIVGTSFEPDVALSLERLTCRSHRANQYYRFCRLPETTTWNIFYLATIVDLWRQLFRCTAKTRPGNIIGLVHVENRQWNPYLSWLPLIFVEFAEMRFHRMPRTQSLPLVPSDCRDGRWRESIPRFRICPMAGENQRTAAQRWSRSDVFLFKLRDGYNILTIVYVCSKGSSFMFSGIGIRLWHFITFNDSHP
jgi:hypothetical protein